MLGKTYSCESQSEKPIRMCTYKNTGRGCCLTQPRVGIETGFASARQFGVTCAVHICCLVAVLAICRRKRHLTPAE